MRCIVLLGLAACDLYFASPAPEVLAPDATVPPSSVGVCGLGIAASYPTGPNPRGVVVADLNADSRVDIVVPSDADLLPVFYGSGGDTWSPSSVQAGSRALAIAVADFTEDGRLDLAVSRVFADPSLPPVLSVLAGGAGGSFSPVAQTLPYTAFHLVAADVNDDGHQDLIASSTTGMRVFLGTGTGAFTSAQPEMMVGQTPTFEVADIDGDHLVDLISLSDFTLTVRATSSPMTNVYATGGVYPRDLAVGDLDDDGDLDIAIVNADIDSVRLFYNDAGIFTRHVDVATDVPPDSDGAGMGSGSNLGAWVPWNIAIADITGDGISDVLVLIQPYAPFAEASQMVVLAQTPDQAFQQALCSLPSRPLDVAVGDFVGDARTDAIVVTAPSDASGGGQLVIVVQHP